MIGRCKLAATEGRVRVLSVWAPALSEHGVNLDRLFIGARRILNSEGVLTMAGGPGGRFLIYDLRGSRDLTLVLRVSHGKEYTLLAIALPKIVRSAA